MLGESGSPWARCMVSAAVHTPTPKTERNCASTAGPPLPPSRVRSSDEATAATRITVSDRCGPTPALCHSHDGTRRHTSAVGNTRIPTGAGPGAVSPYVRSKRRHDWRASFDVTFCSSTDGSSISKTCRQRASRNPGFRRRLSLNRALPDTSRSLQSSPSPRSSGTPAITHSAPAPHAVAATAVRPRTSSRVAAPIGVRTVRHTPLWSMRIVGSPMPRRRGARVATTSGMTAGA